MRLQKLSKDQKVTKVNPNQSSLCSFLILPVVLPGELSLDGVVERIVWDYSSHLFPPKSSSSLSPSPLQVK